MASTFSVKGLHIIDGGKNLAQYHMQFDGHILAELSNFDKPILHFYDWIGPAITWGCFVQKEKFLGPKAHLLFDLAKRPTGGGMILHGADFSFSLAVPRNCRLFSDQVATNYKRVNTILCELLQKIFALPVELVEQSAPNERQRLCMCSLSQYDLKLDGKKVYGASQRKTKSGFLHQCSIFLAPPDWQKVSEAFLGGNDVIRAMKRSSHWLCGPSDHKRVSSEIKTALIKLLSQ